ncbi:peptidoglycan recognition protein family protein [Miniphocaeibacter massiliensis]|uniref:peptidoglycan recognition protein family protein n=1 Tax=Miniphocaeibacter massiliensis TaxID=2041841 RepID=UPI000C1C4CDD|nr:N-acetylmuramoyl-L-alanine amidase [Miniphocaeibacter massiliensis]
MSKSLRIVQMLVPSSKYKIKCPYAMNPTRLVIHNTSNSASALNEISYMIRNNNKVSFHYAVDEKEAIQGILLNRNGWHAGDGNGTGNRYGIGIEICRSKSDTATFLKAEDNGAFLAAKLLVQYGWGMDRLTKHQDYSGKYCPHKTLDLGWTRFKNLVQKYYNQLKKGGSATGSTNNTINTNNDKGDDFMSNFGTKPPVVISALNKFNKDDDYQEALRILRNKFYPSYNPVVTYSGDFNYEGLKGKINYIIGLGDSKGSHTGYLNYFVPGKTGAEILKEVRKLNVCDMVFFKKTYKV